MAYTPTTDDLLKKLHELERRLGILENTNPLLSASITDDPGTVRVELGNLPARGFSGAQKGLRQWNASGQLQFDPFSLGVMGNSLGVSSAGPGQNITSSSFVVTTPAIAITFTLTRPTRCTFACGTTAKQTATGKVGYTRLNLVGVGTTGSAKFGGGGTVGAMDVTNAYSHLICAPGSVFSTLGAGTYTAQVEASTDAAGTLYFDQGFVEGWIVSPASF